MTHELTPPHARTDYPSPLEALPPMAEGEGLSAIKTATLSDVIPSGRGAGGGLVGRATSTSPSGASLLSLSSSIGSPAAPLERLKLSWERIMLEDPTLVKPEERLEVEKYLVVLWRSKGETDPETFAEDFAKAYKIYNTLCPSPDTAYSEIKIDQLMQLISFIRVESLRGFVFEEGQQVIEYRARDNNLPRTVLVFRDGTIIIQLNKRSQDRVFGKGAFSSVKIGWDVTHERIVAISSSSGPLMPATRQGYQESAQVPGGVGLVSRHYQFEGTSKKAAKGKKYLVIMDFIDGRTLHHQLYHTGAYYITTLIQAVELCYGLADLHRHGVVHSDLKPENIMVDKHGHVYLIDLGLASMVTKSGFAHSRGGNVQYAPPQRLNPYSAHRQNHLKHDVFSLGGILWNTWSIGVKSYLRWDSFDHRWASFEGLAAASVRRPDQVRRRDAYLLYIAQQTMSRPGWMLKRGVTMELLERESASGNLNARQALIIARMLSPNLEDRPTAREVGEYIATQILAPLEGEGRGEPGPADASAQDDVEATEQSEGIWC